MSTFQTAIIEVDEYNSAQFDTFSEDIDIINAIGDSFYAYMPNPSDYSKLLFSSGPYNDNCVVVYYSEQTSAIQEIPSSDLDAFAETLSELKRTGNLYLLDEPTMNILIQKVNQAFPIEELNSRCIDMSNYDS